MAGNATSPDCREPEVGGAGGISEEIVARATAVAGSGWSSAPEPLSIELSRSGRSGYSFPALDVPEDGARIPREMLRSKAPAWPEMSENEVVRHFVRLSAKNHHVDKALYPLGSCTMKYNPKVNEFAARLPGMAGLHPMQHESTIQGALELMWELEHQLAAVSGFKAVSLQPAAGAQGELTGLMVIRAWHESRGEGDTRKRVLLPDSAHGTNPASVTLNGYITQELKSDEGGSVDLDSLEEALGDDVACLMITNPNTLGLFESNIDRICELVHASGGLVYMDGANLNALMGIVSPAGVGVDVMHFNLHKTFSTPHGGGGPGAGPIGVTADLEPFLPVPRITREESNGDTVEYHLDWDRSSSIGKVHASFGNFGVLVRAWTYIRSLGSDGLADASRAAVINANYLLSKLTDHYHLPYPGRCMHEFVLSGCWQKSRYGVATTDIAKRLLDYGFYAPTVYFPLIVSEAIMIEPTETETRETLDLYAQALIEIAHQSESDPDLIRDAPHNTPVRRPDEAQAAKFPDLRWRI
ncbi:aminomethyl-transferring glycine dehydrogenase subunit GcvPB [Candidatus Zixiibacteriota bacterium]